MTKQRSRSVDHLASLGKCSVCISGLDPMSIDLNLSLAPTQGYSKLIKCHRDISRELMEAFHELKEASVSSTWKFCELTEASMNELTEASMNELMEGKKCLL